MLVGCRMVNVDLDLFQRTQRERTGRTYAASRRSLILMIFVHTQKKTNI